MPPPPPDPSSPTPHFSCSFHPPCFASRISQSPTMALAPSPTPCRVLLRREASGTDSDDDPCKGAASPSSSWVILGSVARVSDISAGANLSLALQAPPHVAVLLINRNICPSPTNPESYPSIVATDPSGIFLLHSDQGPARGHTVIDLPKGKQNIWWPRSVPGYFVVDAASAAAAAAATPIPNPEFVMHPEPGYLGLVADPKGGGHYMVAELQYVPRDKKATILCFSSAVGKWIEKTVSKPDGVRSSRRVFATSGGVVSYFERLWWVDLSWCILTCNILADAPMLRLINLPPGKELPWWEPSGLLHKKRCVGVSAGKLRFVDMYKNFDKLGVPQVSIWTLDRPGAIDWNLEQETSLLDIVNGDTYKRAGLPRKIPCLALIDPVNPDILYFYVDRRMFGVNVRTQEVVGCEELEIAAPPNELYTRRPVHAWQLPRAPSTVAASCAGEE